MDNSSNAMVLDLNINFNVPEKEQDENFSNVNLAINYIVYAVKQRYQDGLEGQRRRIWGRMQRKMDAALEKDAETKINLESAEVDFLKGLFTDELRFPAAASKYVVVLEDAIRAL